MAWLKKNSNLCWCGFYLAPAPSHPDKSWMGQRSALVAMGWGLMPVYVGQQTAGPGSHAGNPIQGAHDGFQAASLAASESFPRKTCLYLDIEDGSALQPDAAGYFSEWAGAVLAGGFVPGFYCSHNIAAAVAKIAREGNPIPEPRIWAFKVKTTAAHAYGKPLTSFAAQDPANCGFAPAFAWQYEQNAILRLPASSPVAKLTVDLSAARTPDLGRQNRRQPISRRQDRRIPRTPLCWRLWAVSRSSAARHVTTIRSTAANSIRLQFVS
jgi:hypothetical protein